MHSKRKFDFAKSSFRFTLISTVISVVFLLAIGIFGLNYGIDFRSGTSIDISTPAKPGEEKVRTFLSDEGLGDYTLTASEERMSIRFKNVLNEAEETKLRADYVAEVDKDASFEVNIVDVEIAKEQQTNAIVGLAVASLGIMLYVSMRFEWRFAIGAVVSLLYDALFVVGMFSIFRLEVNLPFILAVLTVVGYSINDTVVIFDRIRENLRFRKVKTPADYDTIVNDSIWQTLSRSINTVITVLIASVCLFILGGESIRLFSLAMILGLFSGAYSSIFIASQVWLFFKKRQPIKKAAVKPPAPSTP